MHVNRFYESQDLESFVISPHGAISFDATATALGAAFFMHIHSVSTGFYHHNLKHDKPELLFAHLPGYARLHRAHQY